MSNGFIKDMAKYLPAQVVPGLVGLVSLPIMSRTFLPAEYGYYNLVMATVAVLTTVFGWLPMAIIRYYPAYERQERLDVFRSTIVHLGTGAVVVLTALYYAVLLLLSPWLSARLQSLLMIGGLLFAVTCAFTLLQSILRCRRLVGRYSAFAVWQSVAGFGLGIALVLLFRWGIGGFILGATISMLPTLPLLWRETISDGARIRFWTMDRAAAKATFTYGLPLMVGNLAVWVLSLSDRYILGLFRDAGEVGIYSLSYNIADRSLMLLISLFMMAESAIGMHIWEAYGEEESKRFVAGVTRLFLLLCVPSAVGLSVMSRSVVSILGGAAYVDGHRIVPFVLFGVLLLGIQQRFHWGLLFHQKTSPITLALVIAGLLKVLLNLLFVPRHGYVAAAATTLVCYAVLLILIIRFSRPLFTWKFPIRSLLHAAIASGVMAVAIHWTEHISHLPLPLELLLCIAIGVGIYFAFLLLLGEFSPQELRDLWLMARRWFAPVQDTGGAAGTQ